MSMFALIKHSNFLDRAREEMSDYLDFGKQRNTDSPLDPLIGIWVEQQIFQVLPVEFDQPARTVYGVRIHQSMGFSGIWRVCWVEDDTYARITLLETLIEGTRVSQDTPSFGYLIPVFQSNTKEAQVEARTLRSRYPERVQPPWYQNPSSGRLSLSF